MRRRCDSCEGVTKLECDRIFASAAKLVTSAGGVGEALIDAKLTNIDGALNGAGSARTYAKNRLRFPLREALSCDKWDDETFLDSKLTEKIGELRGEDSN